MVISNFAASVQQNEASDTQPVGRECSALFHRQLPGDTQWTRPAHGRHSHWAFVHEQDNRGDGLPCSSRASVIPRAQIAHHVEALVGLWACELWLAGLRLS